MNLNNRLQRLEDAVPKTTMRPPVVILPDNGRGNEEYDRKIRDEWETWKRTGLTPSPVLVVPRGEVMPGNGQVVK